jgi:hypothetical protein
LYLGIIRKIVFRGSFGSIRSLGFDGFVLNFLLGLGFRLGVLPRLLPEQPQLATGAEK